MPVISIITQHIGLAEEIKGNKTAKAGVTKDVICYKCQMKSIFNV